MAADEFSVSSGRDTTDGQTSFFIGRHSGIIDSPQPPEINTHGSIFQYLKKALADYPQEYRKQNLSVYKLARGADPVPEPLSAPSDNVAAKRHRQKALATARQAVVLPILKEKVWKRGKWATKAGVSKNSVYEYLQGKRNVTDENRRAMAEALELKPEDLPN